MPLKFMLLIHFRISDCRNSDKKTFITLSSLEMFENILLLERHPKQACMFYLLSRNIALPKVGNSLLKSRVQSLFSNHSYLQGFNPSKFGSSFEYNLFEYYNLKDLAKCAEKVIYHSSKWFT